MDVLDEAKEEILKLREQKKLLDWMLENGAAVYYNYDTHRYYCSYHPHRGGSDTPMTALKLAMKWDEERKQQKCQSQV